LAGADTLYNTYWVRFERGAATYANAVANTLRLFAAAREAGVRRVVHLSIANASAGAPLPYYEGKARLEEALAGSGLSHAIVRPTVLFGDEGILLHNIAWLLRHLPVFGVVGDGRYRLQPVHVRDLAALAVDLGADEADVAVDAAGPEVFAYRDLVERIRDAVGSRARVVQVPAAVGLALARVMGLALRDVLITSDELVGLRRELLVSHETSPCPTRLSDWIASHARELGARYRSELALHFDPPTEASS
jgi:NADH dehydrogenase